MAEDYSPTYYGPAKQGQASAAQSKSALNCMVLQPLDDYGTYNDSGNETYVERWKGPTSEMINIQNGIQCMGVTFRVGSERPNLPAGNWIRRFDPPKVPAKWFWKVSEVKVEECNPAGDHSILSISYVARSTDWENKTADGGGRIDTSKQQWSLEWQSRSSSALIYLTKKSGKLKFVKWVNPAVTKDGEDKDLDLENDPDMATFAKMAADAMQSQSVDSRIRLGKYQFVWKDAVYELPTDCKPSSKNVNPQKVVDKYIAGVNPLLHYPILRKTTSANFKKAEFIEFPKWDSATGDKGDPIAKYIDTETDYPKGCPFEFASDYSYKWLKVGDSFQTDKITNGELVYTRNEVWWGDIYWDEDFYNKASSKRWEIGGE